MKSIQVSEDVLSVARRHVAGGTGSPSIRSVTERPSLAPSSSTRRPMG